MPGEQVGAAYAKISLDSKDLDSGMSAAHGRFASFAGGLESRAVSCGKTIGSALAAGVAVAGAALAGAATIGLSAYNDLESSAADAASKAVDISGKSASEIKAQYDSIKEHVMSVSRELGAATVFDPTQVSDAFGAIAAAGKDVSSMTSGQLRPMLDLAASDMNYGLGASTELVMSTMAQFGLTMNDTGKIADVLAKGASGSAASLRDFAYAFKYVGPVAKATGVSLEETTAMIGKLTDKGFSGEQAGTALRSAMLSLGNVTKPAMETLNRLGITYDQVNPRTVKFTDALALMKSKGATVFDLGEIFGKEGASVVESLATMTDEVGAFSTELENSKGAANTMSNLKLDSLRMDLEAAKGAASDLAIGLGENLAPTVRGLLQDFVAIAPEISNFISSIFAGDWSSITDKVSGLAKSAVDAILAYFSSINYDALGERLLIWLQGAWDWATESLRTNETKLTDLIVKPFNALRAVLGPTLTHIWSTMKDAALPACDAMGEAVYAVANAIASGISGAVITAIGYVGRLASALNSLTGIDLGINVGASGQSDVAETTITGVRGTRYKTTDGKIFVDENTARKHQMEISGAGVGVGTVSASFVGSDYGTSSTRRPSADALAEYKTQGMVTDAFMTIGQALSGSAGKKVLAEENAKTREQIARGQEATDLQHANLVAEENINDPGQMALNAAMTVAQEKSGAVGQRVLEQANEDSREQLKQGQTLTSMEKANLAAEENLDSIDAGIGNISDALKTAGTTAPAETGDAFYNAFMKKYAMPLVWQPLEWESLVEPDFGDVVDPLKEGIFETSGSLDELDAKVAALGSSALSAAQNLSAINAVAAQAGSGSTSGYTQVAQAAYDTSEALSHTAESMDTWCEAASDFAYWQETTAGLFYQSYIGPTSSYSGVAGGGAATSMSSYSLPPVFSFANEGYVPSPTLAVIGDRPGGEYVVGAARFENAMGKMGQGVTINVTQNINGSGLSAAELEYVLERNNKALVAEITDAAKGF